MTSPVVAVTTDATPLEVAAVLHRHGFTTVPVIDRNGLLVGLIGEAETARFFVAEARSANTSRAGSAGRLMRTSAEFVRPDTTVADAATTMIDSAERCLPVVSDGRMLGIISWRDVLRNVLAATNHPQRR
ncbi:CBS domain-containing protein [Prauserella alba]|uniref:CBS domain-containing protein n=1 Tax=Prauserella alba TaxID=176898 RepID=A0ABP4G7Q5_9PSEU|nr:CBS domain-containing protein [Prauserella alba]MCP2180880.1 CBS domain-containing protein [Prauserella alba]